MLALILSGFLMSVGGVVGQRGAQAVWDKFVKEHPDQADALPKVFTRWLQASLCAVGEKITVDGDFGVETDKAVKTFQAKQGLQLIDGIAGPRTIEALSAELLKKSA